MQNKQENTDVLNNLVDDNVQQEQDIVQGASAVQHPEELGDNVSISGGANIDLMPVLSKGDLEVIEKKNSFDFRVVIFIFVVALISISFSLYNLYLTNTLENEKKKLNNLESQLLKETDLIRDNDFLTMRYDFYNHILETSVSSKDILVFWQEVCGDLCEIESIEITGEKDSIMYEIEGWSDSLIKICKFWHFLSLDSRVSLVSLEDFSIPTKDDEDTELKFSFEGTLRGSYFSKK